MGNYKNLVDTSAEEYDDMMDTNVRSTFLFTRHTVPVMLQQKEGSDCPYFWPAKSTPADDEGGKG